MVFVCVCSPLCFWASKGLENLCVILSNYLNVCLCRGERLTRFMCAYFFFCLSFGVSNFVHVF